MLTIIGMLIDWPGRSSMDHPQAIKQNLNVPFSCWRGRLLPRRAGWRP
jgi:hypothetical protein